MLTIGGRPAGRPDDDVIGNLLAHQGVFGSDELIAPQMHRATLVEGYIRQP